MYFGLRFDLRNPELAGTVMADRYAAALDMAEWADGLGCLNIALSEHHGSPDGYMPSPIPLISAMAARTTNVRFTIAALIAPFYDPLRLAEDILVLDHLSKGRVDFIVAAGYVPDEFAMYGVPMTERAKRITEIVATLKSAFTGEAFEFRGRQVQVTPSPYQAGGPNIILGGSSETAARRAARMGRGFIPSVPEVWDFYRDEVQKLGGADPGPYALGGSQVTALAVDPEEGWAQMAPFFLHETNAYGHWNAQSDVDSPYDSVTDINALRDTGQYRVITPEELIEEQKKSPFPFINFHPMCGGIPPDLAWSSLRLFEHQVLPAFQPNL